MSEPKLFISYCWSTPEHQEWVMRLGTELRENGVDVVLDKWDLKEGNDANAFMEKMVSDEEIKKVILVIDDQYSERANKRTGGVGTETQIISAEVYESVDQNKFVAVIANRDHEGNAKLPVFYKSRIYIDLSNDELYGKNFEQLLRWVYDKPLNIKPEIGKKPAFLEEESDLSLGTSIAFRRLLEAIRNNRPHAHGALTEYFNLFAENMEKFRIEQSGEDNDFDERVIENIDQFIPSRNELVEVFIVLAQYDQSTTTAQVIHKFFESLIPYMFRPKNIQMHREWDWDNYKFIVNESFILCITIFFKYERFDICSHLINQRYYIEEDEIHGQSKMSSFSVFTNDLLVLQHRNNRLGLRRKSIYADLMKDRCTDSGISFKHVMQADFVLYLVDAMNSLKENTSQDWWPETLVFMVYGGNFEIFLRSESTEYFERLAPSLGIQQKGEFDLLLKAEGERKIQIPEWGFNRASIIHLINYKNLCIRD